MSKALIAGASGAVGRHLIKLLIESERYTTVVSLVRRPSGYQNSKLTEQIVDFDHLKSNALSESIDDVFCCLGTTRKKAGTAEAFRKVDLDYVISLADLALRHGAKRFCVISSSGTESRWGGLYLNTKREMEHALSERGFQHLVIMRPGLLHGERDGFRLGEQIGYGLLKPFSLLPLKSIQAMRPVLTVDVARAMLLSTVKAEKAVEYIDNPTIHRLSE